MNREIYIVGSSGMIERVTREYFKPCVPIASISGSAGYLLAKGVVPDIYGCLERDNVIVFADLMEELKAANPNCKWYFSRYADSCAKTRDWKKVRPEERIVIDHTRVGPPFFYEGREPRPIHSMTGGVLMACQLASEGIYNAIHLVAMEGYPEKGDVYPKGMQGGSNVMTPEQRKGTNATASRAIEWLTNRYQDIEFVMHGNPVHHSPTWRVRYETGE